MVRRQLVCDGVAGFELGAAGRKVLERYPEPYSRRQERGAEWKRLTRHKGA